MKLPIAVLLGALLVTVVSESRAHTWSVPSECPTIQAGVDSASAGDTVLVACGTYYEHDIRMKSGICLRSETGEADCVTIDAQYQSRVFLCENVDSTAGMEGLTITRGDAPYPYPAHGGGMLCSASSLRITACVFSYNVAWDGGGGMCCTAEATPRISDCTFTYNIGHFLGGGIMCYGASPVVTNCTFLNNGAEVRDILDGSGGGLYCGGSPTLEGCIFSGNWAHMDGGGVCCVLSAPASIVGCVFSGNDAAWGGALYLGEVFPNLVNCTLTGNTAYQGAGVCFSHCLSAPGLTSCVLADNSADAEGGGIYCEASSPTLTGCTLWQNSGVSGSGVYAYLSSSPIVENSIIASGSPGEAMVCDTNSSITLTCCNIYGNAGGDWVDCISEQYGVNGNMSEDPGFCNPPAGEYGVGPDSPCLPENNGCGVLIGALGESCTQEEASRIEPTTWSSLKALYR